MGVTVRLNADNSGLFFQPIPLSVDSTAINGERVESVTSVLTLHLDRCNAFYLNGNVNLTFAGGVHVNSRARANQSPCSNSQSAAIGKGGASVVNLEGSSRMRVRGGHQNINIQPGPLSGDIMPDPYSTLPEPSTRSALFPVPANPTIDRKVERQCTQVPYQSPIYGNFDSDGNGTIQAAVDYNGNGVIESLDYDGDGIYGERVENIDWTAGARPNTGGFPNDAYLQSLTVINGDINPVDGTVNFHENEWNDDLDHNGSIDQGIVGYETLYQTVCRDLYAWVMSPGRYTAGVIPSPSAGNYLVFLPGVYIFDQAGQNRSSSNSREVRNGGGTMCTLPADDPNRQGQGGWTYQSVKSYCDSVAAWTAACPSLSDQRAGGTRCGALLHWVGFACSGSNPPALLSAGGNSQTLLRQYLSGAAEGAELERYDGFLLWFSRTHATSPGCNVTLQGGGATQFSGTIYGATTNLSMGGGGTGEAGSMTLQMVVQTLEFRGGSIFDFNYDEAEVARTRVYGLVE